MIEKEVFELGYNFWGKDIPIMRINVDFINKKAKFKKVNWRKNGNRIYQVYLPTIFSRFKVLTHVPKFKALREVIEENCDCCDCCDYKPGFKTFLRLLISRFPIFISNNDMDFITEAAGYDTLEEFISKRLHLDLDQLNYVGDILKIDCLGKNCDNALFEFWRNIILLTEGRLYYFNEYNGAAECRYYSNMDFRDWSQEIEDNIYLKSLTNKTVHDKAYAERLVGIMGDIRAALIIGQTNGFADNDARVDRPGFNPAVMAEKNKNENTYHMFRNRFDLSFVTNAIKNGKIHATMEDLEKVLREEIRILPPKSEYYMSIKEGFEVWCNDMKKMYETEKGESEKQEDLDLWT